MAQGAGAMWRQMVLVATAWRPVARIAGRAVVAVVLIASVSVIDRSGPAAQTQTLAQTLDEPLIALEEVRLGRWDGRAWARQGDEAFTHCAVTLERNRGEKLTFSLGPGPLGLAMTVDAPAVNLRGAAPVEVDYGFDQDPLSWRGTALPLTRSAVRADLPESDLLDTELRDAEKLKVNVGGMRLDFLLFGSARALDWLEGCVRRNTEGERLVADIDRPAPEAVRPALADEVLEPVDDLDPSELAGQDGPADDAEETVLLAKDAPFGGSRAVVGEVLVAAGLGEAALAPVDVVTTSFDIGPLSGTFERLADALANDEAALRSVVVGTAAAPCRGRFVAVPLEIVEPILWRVSMSCSDGGDLRLTEAAVVDTDQGAWLVTIEGPAGPTAAAAEDLFAVLTGQTP